MRVSTSQGYDNATARMNALSARTDRLQQEIATNRKVIAPSDDVGAWRTLAALKTAGADDQANSVNIAAAQTLLTQSDSTLASVQSQVQRAQELAIQANGGALSASDRQTIATQLRGIVDDLYALANTTTASGAPLYGGTGDAAFVRADDGAISYAGNDTGTTIPIGNGTNVVASDSGAKVFGAGASSVFAVIGTLADALDAGTAVPAAAAAGIAGLDTAAAGIAAARGSVGARGARLDLESARLADVATTREVTRSSLEDTDLTSAIAELQKTMTVLQATQASFTKLSQLSLFDYLR